MLKEDMARYTSQAANVMYAACTVTRSFSLPSTNCVLAQAGNGRHVALGVVEGRNQEAQEHVPAVGEHQQPCVATRYSSIGPQEIVR
jgi:hypothetical protein